MYKPNDLIEYNESKLGRVLYHDTLTHVIHVMFRENDFTWKVEKCDEFFCKPSYVYCWGLETAFCVKYQRSHRTPNLVPMRATDFMMELD